MPRPFPFESPVAPEALIDRRAELRRLHLAATDGAHVRVAGPRRFGKTSLLLAHARALSGSRWRTVHVDFYGVTSLAEVCVRIATAYSRLDDHWLRGHLSAIGSRLGLSLTTYGVGVTLGPRPVQLPSHDAALTAAAELIDLPLRLHARDGLATLVVFDEFQDLLSAGSRLDGLLRAHVQYHDEAATYVYAGSQPSMMRRLFTDRERPLYGQAEPLELDALPLEEVHADLAEQYSRLGEDPGEALAPIIEAAAGHPQRTMLLAHLLHRELSLRSVGDTTLPETPDVEGIALADALVGLALRQTAEGHQAVWDGLSAGKKAVLAALADGVRPTGTRATERSGLSRATLQSALRELARDGQHVARARSGTSTAGHWTFVDPLFARWVALRGHP